MNAIKAITFDLDNTLWHIHQAIPKGEQRVFDYLKRQYPGFENHYDVPALRQLMIEILEHEPAYTHQLSLLRKQTLYQAIVNCGYSDKHATQHAQQAFNQFMDARHEVILFDHALEVLETLHQRYQLGALTNGNADINRLPVRPYFDFCYSAEQLLSSKPDPELFQAALKHTGLIASECIHVGDHSEHDIFGAKQAGFFTVWVNINHKPWPEDQPPADAEINCLSELPEAVAKIDVASKRAHNRQ